MVQARETTSAREAWFSGHEGASPGAMSAGCVRRATRWPATLAPAVAVRVSLLLGRAVVALPVQRRSGSNGPGGGADV